MNFNIFGKNEPQKEVFPFIGLDLVLEHKVEDKLIKRNLREFISQANLGNRVFLQCRKKSDEGRDFEYEAEGALVGFYVSYPKSGKNIEYNLTTYLEELSKKPSTFENSHSFYVYVLETDVSRIDTSKLLSRKNESTRIPLNEIVNSGIVPS